MDWYTWGVIAALGASTLLSRGAFLLLPLRHMKLPDCADRALRFAPAAALAAISAPALYAPAGVTDPYHLRMWAGLLALAIAVITRHTLLTLAIGMAALFALRWMVG